MIEGSNYNETSSRRRRESLLREALRSNDPTLLAKALDLPPIASDSERQMQNGGKRLVCDEDGNDIMEKRQTMTLRDPRDSNTDWGGVLSALLDACDAARKVRGYNIQRDSGYGIERHNTITLFVFYISCHHAYF